MAHKILAVDVGNSRAKFGIFERMHDEVQPVAVSAVPLRGQHDVATRLTSWMQPFNVDSSIAAGSNPPVLDRLIEEWPEHLPPVSVIRTTRAIPVTIAVDQPDTVGLDRILNALAAARMNPGQSVIVVDSGTATTVDQVSETGEFCGGTIFPGLRLSAYALHDYTARLPLIDVDAEPPDSPRLPGKTTEEAIRAGLFWGQLGAIREIVNRIAHDCSEQPAVILTGGGGRLLSRHLDQATCVEALALHGLAMLAG